MKVNESAETGTLTNVVCDRCGQSCWVDGSGDYQFGTLKASWGPGSQHVGEEYKLQLCESCFFAQLSSIKRERWTQAMFTDEGDAIRDDEYFGLVPKDR
ncbi:TPA: hypothetical protein N2B23_001280 [Pseudomonas aeruginosa]|nr:hypothetical protein [Pseudomonas aeruginosa]